MGKKDKKSKTAEQKARVAVKQSKKAAQKDKKTKSKEAGDSDEDDVDLQSILEEYAKKQAQFLKVTETSCVPPSPRSSATLIGSPSNNKELFLFGGEYFDGAMATFFNDLLVYLIEKDEWRRVTSPNSPLPRSGHAWCRGGNSGGIYLFGGEFSSPKQGTFYHYNDFWRLDPPSREWTRIESKGKLDNFILLFGGFQDTSQQTKYLQDLWIYDCQNFVWHNPTLPPATQKPDARSSFSFHPHELGAVICGGYSRVKSTTMVGKQTKGGNQSFRSILKPTIHQDTWFLRIIQPQGDVLGPSSPVIRWERRKKPVNAPNPPRAGATMAYHKGRGILFGGVHDVEESEEGIDSEFFDTLLAWNVERNRYFQLTLRRPRATPRKPAEDRGSARRGREKADEAELLRNLAALETKGTIAGADFVEADKAADTENLHVKPVKSIHMTMPHPRFNAQLAVQDDVLYIFGGTYEHGDREYTFDEMWAIDLGRLDGVQEIYRREVKNWQGSDDEGGEFESNDEDDSEDEDMEGNTPMGVPLPTSETGATPTAAEAITSELPTKTDLEEPEAAIADARPHPRPFESLRDFFARTTDLWQELGLEIERLKDGTIDRSIKELRKIAFDLAETKWWDCREEITALEDEQEEAGIGEVVSMTDRGGETGGPNRRR
ncbi:hypothetical protein MMC07_003842 [Pseudocyphellaria aurata]|nr:hypothetical protein [Pseudocyphellaria aurata]